MLQKQILHLENLREFLNGCPYPAIMTTSINIRKKFVENFLSRSFLGISL